MTKDGDIRLGDNAPGTTLAPGRSSGIACAHGQREPSASADGRLVAAPPAGCAGHASAADSGEAAYAGAYAVGVSVAVVVLELAGRWYARAGTVRGGAGILGLAGRSYACGDSV